MDSLTEKCLSYIDQSESLLVVDVSNYLYRFAWSNRSYYYRGIFKGHIEGFLEYLVYLIKKFRGARIILALDGTNSSRRRINENYKTNRSLTEETKEVHDIVHGSFGDVVKLSGLIKNTFGCYDREYEADDVFGSIVTYYNDTYRGNKNIYICTNDKDMYQLVSTDGNVKTRVARGIGTYDRMHSNLDIVTEKEVAEAFNGVQPKDLLKFRAIVGDNSDNIKGYYRFLKKYASNIASNVDYIQSEHSFKLKEGHTLDKKAEEKCRSVILEDFNIFESNYEIMKLRTFNFKISPICSKQFHKDKSEIKELISKYDLGNFYSYIKCTQLSSV